MSTSPTFVGTPKNWSCSIGNADASIWKLLKDSPANNLGAGTNGAKITGLWGTSSDSSARNVQLAICRAVATTVTIASPGVFTANNHGLAVGDQVFLTTTGALPTGLAANTTYYVISAGLTANAFELATSAGGAAINTSVSQSGVHTLYIPRIVTTVPVAITAGTDGATAAANFFNTTYYPGVAVDNDGNPYINLEGSATATIGDFLAVSSTTTVTANKIVNIVAQGGNF